MSRTTIFVLCVISVSVLAGCSRDAAEPPIDRGILWVRTAAEFEALALQAYAAASEDLDRMIADKSWSAFPPQENAEDLPLAIIADVDETVVSNVEFQVTLEQPFKNAKLDAWNDANMAKPIPGAVDFFRKATEAGVTVFYVTNRPCEAKSGVQHPCPQEAVTLQDLIEIGIEVTPETLMLANEQPHWDREKVTRRAEIAKTHRIIMLFGDDLGDFITCSRAKPLEPCTVGATIASRSNDTYKYSDFWGEGWYVLPNPMHGSWTTVE